MVKRLKDLTNDDIRAYGLKHQTWLKKLYGVSTLAEVYEQVKKERTKAKRAFLRTKRG